MSKCVCILGKNRMINSVNWQTDFMIDIQARLDFRAFFYNMHWNLSGRKNYII